MPDTWLDADYRALLAQLEVDAVEDIGSSDLIDMVLMALQDLEPDNAADAVLAYKLKGDVSRGVRRNIIDDLLEQKRPWEDSADIRLHARIFAAAVLLHPAWPKIFTRPDIIELVLRIQPRTAEAGKLLAQPPQAAFVARMLADAMDDHSILERLFDEQLASDRFAEAEAIVWRARFDSRSGADDPVTLTIFSSEHWLESMRSISDFESNAYNDHGIHEVEHG